MRSSQTFCFSSNEKMMNQVNDLKMEAPVYLTMRDDSMWSQACAKQKIHYQTCGKQQHKLSH